MDSSIHAPYLIEPQPLLLSGQRAKRSKQKIFYGQHQQITHFESGNWTVLQKKRYLQFVKKFHWSLKNTSKQRRQRIFVSMSQMVETRSPAQCNSHHQKMMDRFDSIDGIIRHFEPKRKLSECQKKKVQLHRTSQVSDGKQKDQTPSTITDHPHEMYQIKKNDFFYQTSYPGDQNLQEGELIQFKREIHYQQPRGDILFSLEDYFSFPWT